MLFFAFGLVCAGPRTYGDRPHYYKLCKLAKSVPCIRGDRPAIQHFSALLRKVPLHTRG